MRIFALTALMLMLTSCAGSPSPVQPPADLIALDNAFSIARQWSVQVGEGASEKYLRLTPLIKDGSDYAVSHRGLIKVVDVESGKIRWQKQLDMPVSTGMASDGKRLLLGTSDGEVVALDSENGEVLWRAQLSSEVLATPQSSQGVVVARTLDGQLYGLDGQSGERLWNLVERVPSLTLRGASDPVIVGDIVLVGHDNGRMVAVTLKGGEVLWENAVAVPSGRNELERMVDIDATPVVVDDTVYAVAYQGRLVAMRLGSGEIIWTREVGSYVGFAVDAYRIYLSDSEGRLWALDRYNGASLWQQDKLLRRQLSRPALHKDYLVVGDYNGYLHWLQRDSGKIVARRRISNSVFDKAEDPYYEELFSDPHNVLAPPQAVGELLIAVDRRGVMQAFHPDYPQ